ncbi:hypothetical protein RO787_18720 [Blautia coccoides]|uniref:hypothetical protein n=1 Tax=Blautia producta TaxID=33035 RepID=UPI0028A3DFDE|nr:hypothetical protein [Blautia coccoides]MDT4375374.1 hypothetical protein [Blautia coccoides]
MDTKSFLADLYFSDQWLELNQKLWGVRAEKNIYSIPEKQNSKLEVVFYYDEKNRIILPPYNQYLPLRFVPTNTSKESHLRYQWLALSKQLVADLKKHGWVGDIAFTPGFIDARAFSWFNIRFTLKYTYYSELPVDINCCDCSIRKNTRKALKNGYYVKRTSNIDEIYECLYQSARRKKIDLGFQKTDLKRCWDILGPENIIGYVAYNIDGFPVSAQVKLLSPNGVCIDWLAGTKDDRIKDGVNQLLYSFSFEDLHNRGEKYFDFGGANNESISQAKSQWCFELVPMLVVKNRSPLLEIKSWICKYRFFNKLRTLYKNIF